MTRRSLAVIGVMSLLLLAGCAGAGGDAESAPQETYTPPPAPVYVEDVYPGGVPLEPGGVIEAGGWAITDVDARKASDIEETMPASIQMSAGAATPVTDEQRATLVETEPSLADREISLVTYTVQLLTDIPEGFVARGGNSLFDPVLADGTAAGLTAYTLVGSSDLCRAGQDFTANNGRNVEGAVTNGCFVVAWDDAPPGALAFVGDSGVGVRSPFAEAPALFLLPEAD